MWDKFRKSPPLPTDRPPRINWNVFVKFARSCHFLFQSSPAPSLSRRRRITRGKNRVKSLRRTQTTVCKQFLFFLQLYIFQNFWEFTWCQTRAYEVEVANWPQWRENLENVNCSLAFSLDHWLTSDLIIRKIIGKRKVLLKNNDIDFFNIIGRWESFIEMFETEIIHSNKIGWVELEVMSSWSDDKAGTDDNNADGSNVVEKDYW